MTHIDSWWWQDDTHWQDGGDKMTHIDRVLGTRWHTLTGCWGQDGGLLNLGEGDIYRVKRTIWNTRTVWRRQDDKLVRVNSAWWHILTGWKGQAELIGVLSQPLGITTGLKTKHCMYGDIDTHWQNKGDKMIDLVRMKGIGWRTFKSLTGRGEWDDGLSQCKEIRLWTSSEWREYRSECNDVPCHFEWDYYDSPCQVEGDKVEGCLFVSGWRGDGNRPCQSQLVF